MRHILLLIAILAVINLSAQDSSYTPKANEGIIVEHTYYTLSHVAKYKQAEWVSYTLTYDMLDPNIKRKDAFKADPLIPNESATPKDYSKSGYDRGHLAPAADMAINRPAMNESFYMTNMSPQAGGFNRGIWKSLEAQVRHWADSLETIYIVTGPILDSFIDTIASGAIPVPAQYYKAILYKKDNKYDAIGFILSNEKSSEPLKSFIVSIDSIESRIGTDLFHQLDDKIEDEIEANSDAGNWTFSTKKKSKQKPANEKDSSRCTATNKDGTQCRNKTKHESGKCHLHR